MTNLSKCSGVSTPQERECKRERFTHVASTCGTRLACLLILLWLGAASLSAQTYQDLYEFNGTGGGCCPQYPAVMAQGRDGNIYGTTATGGANNVGIVFKITPTGSFTVLHNFDTTHGSTPVGGLVLGTDGNLYGTTEFGGAQQLRQHFQDHTRRGFNRPLRLYWKCGWRSTVSPLVWVRTGISTAHRTRV